MRSSLLPALGVAAAVAVLGAVGCSPVTVDVTIPIASPDLWTGTDHAAQGFVQGYLFTPDGSGAAAAGAPIIVQTPEPPNGYQLTSASSVVSIPAAGGVSTRPDVAGFFYFAGYGASNPPVTVAVDFPGGGFPSFTTDVPIVPLDRAGLARQRVDLDQTTQYRNNAGDIRSMAGCRLNFTISASEAARFRLYAAARGDLTAAQLIAGEEGALLIDWTLQAGSSRNVSDQHPQEEGKLAALGMPKTGRRILHTYLVGTLPGADTEPAAGGVSGLVLYFRARVAAPF